MNKIITVLIIAGVLLGLAFLGYSNAGVRDAVADILPLQFKQKVKDTLFVIPSLREQIATQEMEVIALKSALSESKRVAREAARKRNFTDISSSQMRIWQVLSRAYSQSSNELLLRRKRAPTISSSKGEKYQLDLYELPFLPTRFGFGLKPLLYIDSTSTDFYAVTGDGVLFRGAISDLGNNTLAVKTIPSNLRQLIDDEEIYKPGWFSIKDLKIHDAKVYLSYTKKIRDSYTISIVVADLSADRLEFSEFFTIADNANTSGQFNAHQVGGRIVNYKDNKFLVSTGDFRKWVKPQDPATLLGKIFSIDLDSKQTELISIGHRNVQGLHYDPESGLILSTEHGPSGGDEINLNASRGNQVVNFGWPISSYGAHYDGRVHAEAPLHKSHSDHGFTEPLKYFTPSVGISQIIKLPNAYAAGFSNDYFAASMGMNPKVAIHSLHHIRIDANNNQIIRQSIIPIGERTRDMHLLDDKRLLLALEGNNTPAIAILKAN